MAKQLDLSAYQHPNGAGIDFHAVRGAGYEAVIIKASQGLGYVNPFFTRDADEALASGLEVDAYHFFDPAVDAVAQARFFHQAVAGRAVRRVADDAEIGGGNQTGMHLAFLSACSQLFNLPPASVLFYSYLAWFGAHLDANPGLAQYSLWIADYGPASAPAPPRPWDHVTLWQDRSNARVPGIVGSVDEDLGALAVQLAQALGIGIHLVRPLLGATGVPGGAPGWAWFVAGDGGVFAQGGAPFLGSLGGMHLNAPVVAIAPTPTGRGYWLAAADGGVFAFGDAAFHGSVPADQAAGRMGPLNAPVTGIAGYAGGYRLCARDGGVFDYGVGHVLSMSGRADTWVIAAGPTPSGGILLAGQNGAVYASDDFRGGMHGTKLNAPMCALAVNPDGSYRLVGADGGVFDEGCAPVGSASGRGLPIVGAAATPSGAGLAVVAADGRVVTFGDSTVPSL